MTGGAIGVAGAGSAGRGAAIVVAPAGWRAGVREPAARSCLPMICKRLEI